MQTIEHDLECVHCGYNLRTLSTSAKCPECGRDVAGSLVQNFPVGVRNVAHLRRVRLGAALIVISILLYVVAFLIGWVTLRRENIVSARVFYAGVAVWLNLRHVAHAVQIAACVIIATSAFATGWRPLRWLAVIVFGAAVGDLVFLVLEALKVYVWDWSNRSALTLLAETLHATRLTCTMVALLVLVRVRSGPLLFACVAGAVVASLSYPVFGIVLAPAPQSRLYSFWLHHWHSLGPVPGIGAIEAIIVLLGMWMLIRRIDNSTRQHKREQVPQPVQDASG